MGLFVNDAAYDAIIGPIATAYASQAGLSVGDFTALIKATIRQESNFDPNAYRAEPQIGDASRGLMQLLDRTARGLGFGGASDDLYDPHTNILYGARLLAQNLQQADGRLDVAVSAYNAGFSRERPHDAKRDSTGAISNAAYVTRVLGFYDQYRAASPSAGSGVTTAALGLWPLLIGGGLLALFTLWRKGR